MDMNFEQLNFTTYCVGNLAEALKMSASKFTDCYVHQVS